MADTIQTITDKSQFAGLFSRHFQNREVFLRTKSGDMLVQFLGYHDDNVAFRIPRVKSLPEMIVVFARTGDDTIYASLKSIERNEDTFIFLPVKFQVITEKRREERTPLGEGEGKTVLFISSLISESMMQSFLESGEKKVRAVKSRIETELKGKFDRVRVVFINEARIDIRMKRFMESWAPLFIPDMGAPPGDQLKKDYQYYLSEVYPKDYRLSSQKELISEIAVPFIYRNILPFGYIQVNNATMMTETHLKAIRRLAVMIGEYFIKDRIFVPAEERFIINDISKKGMGIVFRDRRQLKYFVKDARLILEMPLPDKTKVVMGAVVRNTLFHDNGIIKVGLEITSFDPVSEANYDEFLEKIGR